MPFCTYAGKDLQLLMDWGSQTPTSGFEQVDRKSVRPLRGTGAAEWSDSRRHTERPHLRNRQVSASVSFFRNGLEATVFCLEFR
jgi:hypothetical protein